MRDWVEKKRAGAEDLDDGDSGGTLTREQPRGRRRVFAARLSPERNAQVEKS